MQTREITLSLNVPTHDGRDGGSYFVQAPNEPLRSSFGLVLSDLFVLFNQKQTERGPENVIKAGADGILTQCAERIERVRAALSRGQTSQEELRLNALDIAGFGVILTMILDGTWVSPDGRKPATTASPQAAPTQAVDAKARAFLRTLAEGILMREGVGSSYYTAAQEFLK